MKKLKTVLVGLTCLAIAACAKKSDTTDESIADSQANTAESTGAAVGGIANDTETGGTVGIASVQEPTREKGDVQAQAACTLASARSTCSGEVATVTFNGCTIASGAIALTGGWTNTYLPAGTCASAQSGSFVLPASSQVTRTSSAFAIAASGFSVTTDTTAHSAWDGTAIPTSGTGVVTARGAGTGRTVTINALRRIMRGPRGTKWFDHSLTTPTSLTVAGARASGDRVVSGTVKLYHNLARYTATSTLSNVTWGSATCCYPTSGSISTTFSGAVTGTSMLQYSGTCGSATFTDTTGGSGAVTLSQCE